MNILHGRQATVGFSGTQPRRITPHRAAGRALSHQISVVAAEDEYFDGIALRDALEDLR